MPALLSSRVFLYPSRGKFPTEAALLELGGDNTVRLTKVDPVSGARRDVVFDESLVDIQIGGAGTSLTFQTHGGDRWRVDFSPYNAGQRVITAEQANHVIMNRADVGVWVAKLKELGYPSGYRSSSSVRMIVIVTGAFVVIVVVLVVLNALAHPVFT